MGLMYPKAKRKKRRKKHPPSILHQKDGTCYLCIKLKDDWRRYRVVHEHHVYDGKNKIISEENGFKVYLCLNHHIDGPEAVHNKAENMLLIQRDCQKAYEETHSRKEFLELIGKSYL